MAYETPCVDNTMLHLDCEIKVESDDWWQWLEQPATTTFRFRHEQGNYTARREWKRSGWYWYAYRRYQGKLHKRYLGKSHDLTYQQLVVTAQQLSTQIDQERALLDQMPAGPVMKAQESTWNAPTFSSTYSAVPMGSPLLTTKLYPPPLRRNILVRPRLIEHLEAGLSRRLMILSAPAGFGKSTVLGNWLHHYQDQRYYCWISLDREDNDPLRFWHYCAAALQAYFPHLENAIASNFQRLAMNDFSAFLALIINIVATSDRPVVFILDDYHTISSQNIHDSLLFLIDHLPEPMHVVIASRSEPPFPLTRLRIYDHLYELRAPDLRFTKEEVEVFLNQMMQLHLSPHDVQRLDHQTEGWIAGLQLAAISIQGNHTTPVLANTFTGSHRYVLEYLSEEVLKGQPPPIRMFLLSTSILERLSADLCNVVTEQEDSAPMLTYLEHANLFLIPLDEQGEWYRYHHLFAEFLQIRLAQEQPALVPELHRRACSWYKKHGLISASVHHAMETGDMELVAEVLEQFAQTMIGRGEIMTFLSWLHSLPTDILHAHSYLLLYKAGGLITMGQLDEAECCLQLAEALIDRQKQEDPDNPLLQQRECELISARVVLLGFRGNITETVALAQKAFELLDPNDSYMQNIVLAGLGSTYLFNGQVEKAHEAFQKILKRGQNQHNDQHTVFTSMACEGYLAVLQGKLRQGAEIYQETIRRGTREGGRIISVVSMVYVLYARLCYEWDRLDEAEYYANEGIALGNRWGYVGMLTLAYTILAMIAYQRGEKEQALAQMHMAVRLAREHTLPYIIVVTEALQAQMHLYMGQLNVAVEWVHTRFLQKHDINDHRNDIAFLIAIEILIAQKQLAEAQYILSRLLAIAEKNACNLTMLEGQLLQVMITCLRGHRQQALHLLIQTLARLEPEGFFHMILDKGEPLRSLVCEIDQRHLLRPGKGPSQRYLKQLVQSHHDLAQPEKPMLSKREHHILACIAEGKTNQDIAVDLTIALSTVKSHINNIYTKLDVHSRAQAIMRAQELGLL